MMMITISIEYREKTRQCEEIKRYEKRRLEPNNKSTCNHIEMNRVLIDIDNYTPSDVHLGESNILTQITNPLGQRNYQITTPETNL